MKRILLFLATNLAVMVVLSVVVHLLGVDRYLTAQGIDYRALLVFSAVIGFAGSIISLLMSKWMAKMSTGARVIDGSEGSTEYWLVQTVHRLADKAGIGHPEVAVYEGEPNAFATGAFKNEALVAVSTGLLQGMSREQVEAVLGHEISHVAHHEEIGGDGAHQRFEPVELRESDDTGIVALERPVEGVGCLEVGHGCRQDRRIEDRRRVVFEDRPRVADEK